MVSTSKKEQQQSKPRPQRQLRASSVFVRIRPKAEHGGHVDEEGDEENAAKRLHDWSDDSLRIADRHGIEEYAFPKKVLRPDISQEEMYTEMLPKFVQDFVKLGGHNVLFFAYGQTGTGKTHTIFGPEGSLKYACLQKDWGIFPRVVHNVLEIMAARPSTRFQLLGSAIEFYLGTCRDLLAENNPILIGEDNTARGHTVQSLTCVADLLPFLAQVKQNRSVRATKMNEKTQDCGGSSRSHCALMLTLLQVDANDSYSKTTFTLIDFAGAERPSKTGEERKSGMDVMLELYLGREIVSTGAQAFVINWELFELGSAVLQATRCHKSGKKYAPPKQAVSDFLKFVASCMDGRAMLGMVITISQAARNGWETWFTMKYGTELAKLRAPCVTQPVIPLKNLVRSLEVKEQQAEDLLAKTPRTGAPSSKYFRIREIELAAIRRDRELLSRFAT